MNDRVDERYYESITEAGLAARLLVRARRRMYDDLLAVARPTPATTFLDLGVSDVLGEGANFFEQAYPYPERVQAAGLGEATDFQQQFPRIAYTQIGAGEPLPFADNAFDVVISNAVLEHTGSPQRQRAFLAEAMRVAPLVFVTVPHRYFPVEHHTRIPLAHWSDRTFRLACRITGKDSWADPAELILMSRRRLRAVVPEEARSWRIGRTGLRAGLFSSNLALVIDQRPGGVGHG